MAHLMRKMRTLGSLPPAERRATLRAALLLPLARVGPRLVGARRLATWVANDAPGGPPSMPADAWTRAVERAIRNSPLRPNCLQRSLLLQYLLRRDGWPAELRIGVKRSGDGLDAHAWVELAGNVLNDHDTVQQEYVPFAGTISELNIRRS